MFRSNLVSRIWRSKELLKFSHYHSSKILKFELSSTHFDSNDYLDSLYSKLRLKDGYSYLDTNLSNQEVICRDQKLASTPEFTEFLRILASAESEVDENILSEIQKQFSDKFQEWTKVSQLRVGFLMHLDKRINSSQYLDKVVNHLTSTYDIAELDAEDLTALMLLIYFKRDYTMEKLSEYLDLEALQVSLSIQMASNKMTQEEVCAVCLGLKRIADMRISNKYLRTALYNQLEKFKPNNDPLDDFYVITLMTTLSRGNLIYSDSPEQVTSMLNQMAFHLNQLKTATKIKLLTFPLSLGFGIQSIEEEVFSDFANKLTDIETWDLVQICSYISKQDKSTFPLDEIIDHLEKKLDNIKDEDELMDIIQCFHYMSHVNKFSEKFNKLLFSEINQLPSELFASDLDLSLIAEKVSRGMISKLNIATIERDKSIERNDQKSTSMFTRLPSFISSSYSLECESVDPEAVIHPKRCFQLSRVEHRKLPMELLAPQMKTNNLELRWKQIVNYKRALVRFMGSEDYVGVTRILPHFTEPDLVFGNIGGICLSIPQYLTSAHHVGPRAAPPGDWWVLVIGMSKTFDNQGNIIGQEAAKIRQLKKLGYNPLVTPYSVKNKTESALKTLHQLLKSENVSLPNLDDGYRERKRKF